MSDTKTHWKKLANPDYIGAYSLMVSEKPIDLTVKIKSIAEKMVKGPEGKEEKCTVVQLDGQKPFILNNTNSKTLEKLFASPYIEDWVGKSFTLYVARVKSFGDTIDALRIRPTLPTPKALPELTPQSPRWDDALKAVQAKNTTVDVIRKSYILSPENEKLLCSPLKSDAPESAT